MRILRSSFFTCVLVYLQLLLLRNVFSFDMNNKHYHHHHRINSIRSFSNRIIIHQQKSNVKTFFGTHNGRYHNSFLSKQQQFNVNNNNNKNRVVVPFITIVSMSNQHEEVTDLNSTNSFFESSSAVDMKDTDEVLSDGNNHNDPKDKKSYRQFRNYIVNLQNESTGNNQTSRTTGMFVQLVDDNHITFTENYIPINSLIFSMTSIAQPEADKKYVLVIIESIHYVDTTKLERILMNQFNDPSLSVKLVKSNMVDEYCGFVRGTVPPIGLHPSPHLVVIEESLVTKNVLDDTATKIVNNRRSTLLVGGGGIEDQSCILNIQTLLTIYPYALLRDVKQMNTKSKLMKSQISTSSFESTTTTSRYEKIINEMNTLRRMKPFFPVAPPPDDVAQYILRERDEDAKKSLIQSEYVEVIGRIARVRQMAKKLVFLDFVPLSCMIGSTVFNEDGDYQWRNPIDGKDMAVQIICGTTMCELLGEQVGIDFIRTLSKGQLLWIKGKTNVNTFTSLENWVSKRSLDIVMYSYEILPSPQQQPRSRSRSRSQPTFQQQKRMDLNELIIEQPQMSESTIIIDGAPFSTYNNIKQKNGKITPPTKWFHQQSVSMKTTTTTPVVVEPISYLRLDQLYPLSSSQPIQVNDTTSLMAFTNDMIELEKKSVPPEGFLFGMDCEWKPTFLLQDGDHNNNNDGTPRQQQQPVLVLQICVHPLQKVYVFDLQSLLLRPFRGTIDDDEPMNEVEMIVSESLGRFLQCPKFVKVGFQLTHDLRRLATSYPHIIGLHRIDSVLEITTLARVVLKQSQKQVKKVSNTIREPLSSLSKLTYALLGKYINKEQQCSDWSQRPLSSEQMEYAALDAVVTCAMVDTLLPMIQSQFFDDPIRIGGDSNVDSHFKHMLTCWRFTMYSSNTDSTPNLNERVENLMTPDKTKSDEVLVITQSWTSGEKEPAIPSLVSADPNFIKNLSVEDNKIVGIPSKTFTLVSSNFDTTIDMILGEQVGKTKTKCIKSIVKLQNSFSSSSGVTSTAGGEEERPQTDIDIPHRTGYIEFQDALVLFVNMPKNGMSNRGQPRSFPNEWFNNGQVLSWFVRNKDWQDGSTDVARKIIAARQDTNMDDGGTSSSARVQVVLFVRNGYGAYVCCGRCHIVPPFGNQMNTKSSVDQSNNDLIKLHLLLQDWNDLMSKKNFQRMVNPGYISEDDDDMEY